MAPGISYDDSGSLASYFGVTCLAFILVPASISTFRPAPKGTSVTCSNDHVACADAFSALRQMHYPSPHPSAISLADPHKSLCCCNECRANDKRKASLRSASHRRKLLRRFIPLALGWALFAWVAYGLWTAPPTPETSVYDPFEILGIGSSSTDKEIKKHYKKLSLQLYVTPSIALTAATPTR